jgi:hypothetical protein
MSSTLARMRSSSSVVSSVDAIACRKLYRVRSLRSASSSRRSPAGPSSLASLASSESRMAAGGWPEPT